MTKGEIDRLGQRIGESKSIDSKDLELLQEYRQTFQEPISQVFNFVLKAARRIDRHCIVTYRIKRIDTIIEKLRRFERNDKGRMNLSRMWDIAGCRCIMSVSSTEKLYQLKDVLLEEYGVDSKVNDHINTPKDSGYRSLHVYVKDKQTQKPVEIQIRNRSQHNWATLVEIVDLLYGTKQKEQGATGQLGRFLYLYSRATDLTNEEFSEMLQIERKMKVFERMSDVLTKNYLNIRRQWLKQKQYGTFFVITANKTRSEILSYPTFKDAENAYYDKYLANADSNIVLTHLSRPDFSQISVAYSNYVLAMHAFFDDYRDLVGRKIIECIRVNDYYDFFKDFKIYNSNLKYHFRNLSLEINDINACLADTSISRNQIHKWQSEIRERWSLWKKETQDFIRVLAITARGSRVKKWLIRNRIIRMTRAITAGQKEGALKHRSS